MCVDRTALPSNSIPQMTRTLRSYVALGCFAAPLVALLAACGSDSTSPSKAHPTADTVGFDPGTAQDLEHYYDLGSDSGYYSYAALYDGYYVENDDESPTDYSAWRLIEQVALPTLVGQGVVDSAKMYEYVCDRDDAMTDSVTVDHIYWGAAFTDSASYVGQTVQANIGPIVADTMFGWHSLNVTSSVQADYAAKHANSQYRLEYLTQAGPNYVELGGVYCNDDGGNTNAAGQAYMVIWQH
jgi:hypothetical protein